jgi:hypothetical protein
MKWTGWLSEYNSWEPAEYLAKAPKKIQEFKHARKQKQKE